MKITEHQAQSEKEDKKKTTFEPAAAVGGTSSIYMLYLLVSLVPSYPLCHLRPTFVHRGFPSNPPVPPPPHIPSGGFPSTPPVAPPSPHSVGHHPARIELAPSRPKSGILTILLLYIHKYIYTLPGNIFHGSAPQQRERTAKKQYCVTRLRTARNGRALHPHSKSRRARRRRARPFTRSSRSGGGSTILHRIDHLHAGQSVKAETGPLISNRERAATVSSFRVSFFRLRDDARLKFTSTKQLWVRQH